MDHSVRDANFDDNLLGGGVRIINDEHRLDE